MLTCSHPAVCYFLHGLTIKRSADYYSGMIALFLKWWYHMLWWESEGKTKGLLVESLDLWTMKIVLIWYYIFAFQIVLWCGSYQSSSFLWSCVFLLGFAIAYTNIVGTVEYQVGKVRGIASSYLCLSFFIVKSWIIYKYKPYQRTFWISEKIVESKAVLI